MLWDRSNRFSPSKRDETILTYESFSDYLRQQFLQSRNLFHHYKEYRKSQKEKRHKQDTRKIHADFQSPPKVGEEITPATSMTDDLPVKVICSPNVTEDVLIFRPFRIINLKILSF